MIRISEKQREKLESLITRKLIYEANEPNGWLGDVQDLNPVGDYHNAAVWLRGGGSIDVHQIVEEVVDIFIREKK